MTLPDERYRAIRITEQFLRDLCDRSKTPRVPKSIRAQASSCLRHYPSSWDLKRLEQAAPEVVQERMEPLHKMIVTWDQTQQTEGASAADSANPTTDQSNSR
jgi:hypothetical protein